jgi:NAD(P)-dependent dehydrogenase (short-subunit alcohol dehydrogenase family)
MLPAAFDLSGKRVLVTGAARGIGEATARAFAHQGCTLVLCDRLDAELAVVAAELSESVEVHSHNLDVRDTARVEEMISASGADLGGLDIVVNNAGGGFFAKVSEVNAKGTAALVAENFTQVLDVSRLALPLMTDGGAVVNITSIEAHRAGPGFGIYSAMKAAVENLTRTLALEWAEFRIRVNAVAPDMIPTPGDSGLADAAEALSTSGEWQPTPWPDEGTPEDVANAVLFLASDMAKFITGQTVHVDGGTLAASGWKRRRSDGVWVL